MDTVTLFGPEGGALDDGGWGSTFAKMNAKQIVQRVSKELREKEKKRAAEKKKDAARHIVWDRERRKKQAEKEKWPVVVAEGKRAEELALKLLKGQGDGKSTLPAFLVIEGGVPSMKAETVRRQYGQGMSVYGEGSKAGTTSSGLTREVPEKKMYETLRWKDVVEVAERIVQSPKRPDWMESVEKTKRLMKAWALRRKAEEKERAAQSRIYAARDRKYATEQRRLARMSPAQRKRHDERKRREYERKNWKAIQESRKREAEWKHKEAIYRANKKWLKDTAARVGQIIKEKTGREASLEEIAGFINDALRIRGFGGDFTKTYVGPETDESTLKPTGRFRFWGSMDVMDTLLPGAKLAAPKKVEEEEEQESGEEEEEE